MPKVKYNERILKAARDKQVVTYKGVPIRLSADISKETLQARRDWQEVFKVMKSRNLERNQDGGVGRHTAPPRTTRPDRESNSNGDRHQRNRK